MDGSLSSEYRCYRCYRLLFRGHIEGGSVVEIQCWYRQCRYMNTITLDTDVLVAVS